MNKELSWNEFQAVDIRVGTVKSAKLLESAKNPAYVLTINFGDGLGTKKSSAQLTEIYKPEDLLNTQVLAVVNFPKKQIATIMSECLVLGLYSEKGIVLLRPDQHVENGARVA
jgi:tRNA-binding protein